VIILLIFLVGIYTYKKRKSILGFFTVIRKGIVYSIKALIIGWTILLKALKEGLWLIFTKLIGFLDAIFSWPIRTILKIKASRKEKKKEEEEKELIIKKEERKEKTQEREGKASELGKFIAESMVQGLSKEQIKGILLKKRWPKEIVEEYTEKIGKKVEKEREKVEI